MQEICSFLNASALHLLDRGKERRKVGQMNEMHAKCASGESKEKEEEDLLVVSISGGHLH